MSELERLNKDISNNEELAKKMEEAIRRIVERKEAESDGEAIVKVANELGYKVTRADLEREQAKQEALDLEAMAMVSGGDDTEEDVKWCASDYQCYTVLMNGGGKRKYCFSDYYCVQFSKSES